LLAAFPGNQATLQAPKARSVSLLTICHPIRQSAVLVYRQENWRNCAIAGKAWHWLMPVSHTGMAESAGLAVRRSGYGKKRT